MKKILTRVSLEQQALLLGSLWVAWLKAKLPARNLEAAFAALTLRLGLTFALSAVGTLRSSKKKEKQQLSLVMRGLGCHRFPCFS